MVESEGIMKRRKPFFLIIVIALMLTCITPVTANATAGPVFPKNLLWNITDIHYYLVGAAIGYDSEVAAASLNWWRPFGPGSNNLNPNTRTYNQTDSAIDYYRYFDAESAVLAYTNFVRNTSSGKILVEPTVSNWSFGRIYLNGATIRDPDSAANAGMSVFHFTQGVIGHEQGHVFALAHNNTNPHTLMCQTAYGRDVYLVQVPDNDAFNLKH